MRLLRELGGWGGRGTVKGHVEVECGIHVAYCMTTRCVLRWSVGLGILDPIKSSSPSFPFVFE
jgi:hypothetical protein